MPQIFEPVKQSFTEYQFPFEPTLEKPPSFGEGFKAGFMQENDINALVEIHKRKTFPEVPNYDLLNALKERNLTDDIDLYLGSKSDQEVEARTMRIAMERKRRDTAERAGFVGYLGMISGGVVSPFSFIPLIKGASLTASAVKTAAAVGTSVAAQEAILFASQETRTKAESALSIAASTVLGGVLGVAGHQLGKARIDKMAEDMADPPGASTISEPMPRFDEPSTASAFQAVGEGGKLKSNVVNKPVLDQLSKLSPVTRLIQQPSPPDHMPTGSPLAREIGGKFSQAGLRVEGNIEGFSAAPGGNVENVIKGYAGLLDDTSRKLEQTFKDYVFSGKPPAFFPMTRAKISGALSKEIMNYDVYKREVFLAVSEGGTHPNSFVQKAADIVKKHIDDLYEDGVAAKVFTGKEAVKGDKAYISHLWDTVKINSNTNALIKVLADHFNAKKIMDFEEGLTKVREKQSKAATFIEDIERPDDVVQEYIKKFREELMDLDDALPFEVAQLELEAKNLREKARKLEGKEKADALALARDSEARGGPALEEHKAKKAAIRSRLANLASARVSVSKRLEAKLSKIERNEELQLETMLRGAKQAQKLLALIAKGTDKEVEEALSKFKTMFAQTAEAFDRAEEQIVRLTSQDNILQASGKPEKIEQAASLIEGNVYTGVTHVEALELAAKDMNTTVEDLITKYGERGERGNVDGFITSKGRFVDRAEADTIARKNDQLESEMYATKGSLSAEALGPDDTLNPNFVAAKLSNKPEDNMRLLDEKQQARMVKLDDLAERIDEIESFDKVKLVAEVEDAAKEMLEVHANINARRAVRNERLKAQAQKLTPEEFQAKVDAKKAAAARLGPDFVERQRVGGGEKIDLEKGTVDFSEYVNQAALDTVNKLKGTERRLAYSDIIQDKRGPELARVLDIPATKVLDWLETDIQKVMNVYTRTLAADNTISRTFGNADMSEVLTKLTDEQDKAVQAIMKQVDKEGKPISKEARNVLEDKTNKYYKHLRNDIYTLLERARGMRGIPTDPDAASYRLGKIALELNNVRYMGGAAIASIPDPSRVIQRHSLLATFRDGFIPLITAFPQFKISAREARLAGTANEIVTHSRQNAMTNVFDDEFRGTLAERGLTYASSRMGIVSGLNLWTQAWQSFTAAVVNAKLLDSMAIMMGEKASAKQTKKATEFLASVNITPDIVEAIWKTQATDGVQKVNGVWLPNTENWDITQPAIKQARRAYRAALAGEVDDTIVRPGFERASFVDKNIGFRMFSQFKSFALSSTQKTVMAGLQQGDMAYVNGMMISLAMGALSYYLYSMAAGGKTQVTMENSIRDGNWELWADEAIARSGQTAIFDSVQRFANRVPIINKVTSFSGGPRTKTIGGGLEDELGGPSFDLLVKLGKVLQSGNWDEPNFGLTRQEMHLARQIMPFQNLFYTRRLLSQIENAMGDAFGLQGKRQ